MSSMCFYKRLQKTKCKLKTNEILTNQSASMRKGKFHFYSKKTLKKFLNVKSLLRMLYMSLNKSEISMLF